MSGKQVHLSNQPVCAGPRKHPAGAVGKKYMEDHIVILSILRMPVSFPIAGVHIDLNPPFEDPVTLHLNRRVYKIWTGCPVPDSKLYNAHPLARGSLKVPSKLARVPARLHLQLNGSLPSSTIAPHTIASSVPHSPGARVGKFSPPPEPCGWNKICSLPSMPQLLSKACLTIAGLLSFAVPLLQAEVREIATISTNAGVMEFELFRDVSPRTVQNFKYLADNHFYDYTAFHRAIAGFMIQGGDPNTRYAEKTDAAGNSNYGSGGPGYTIPDEPVDTKVHPDRAHVRGVLSMAKTAYPDSGGSGFFIMYGNAPHLDGVHAPIGSLISGEGVLQTLEGQPVGGTSGTAPLTRLAVNSVRIRSEEIPDSAPVSYTVPFTSGMANGLLRNFDRNIFGSFQLSFTKTGSLSGQFEYFGRRSAFAGKLSPIAGSTSESECTVLVDSKALFPLRVRVRARRAKQTGATISITVCGLNSDNADPSKATDKNDYTLACGSTELAIPDLSNRYTAVLKPNGFANGLGSAFLALNFFKASGLCIASGKLPDGRSLAFSKVPSNEGGRYVFPVFIFELPKTIEVLRSQFPSVNLEYWPVVGSPNGQLLVGQPGNQLLFKMSFCLEGALEMRPAGDPADITPPTAPARKDTDTDDVYFKSPEYSAFQTAYAAYSNWVNNLSYLYWYRQAVSTNSVPETQSGFLYSTMAPWTPPVAGSTLPPFAAGAGAGHIQSDNLASTAFQISRTNTTTTFASNPAGVILRFNPLDGTFQGSYAADGGRLNFYGINVKGSGYTKSWGFALKPGASVPVTLTAP